MEAELTSFVETADSEPWEYYEQLRRSGTEVFWDERFDAWMIASYRLCKDVLKRDERMFRRADAEAAREDPTLMTLKGSDREITVLTGDEHQRFHRWWLRAVSQEAVARWRPTRIRPVIDSVIDRFSERGHAELASELTTQVPIRVMASTIGLPWEDEDWIAGCREFLETKSQYLESLWAQVGDVDSVRERALGVVAEFRDRLRPFAEAARSSDADDVTAMYWRDGKDILPDWDIEDVITGMMTAFFAGSDTTAHGMTNAMWMLLTRRGLQEQLRGADDQAIGRFVEESLRIVGVAHFVSALRANQDFEVGGVEVKKDQKIHALLASANRDPEHYGCPHDVDLQRTSPRDHMAFYMGARTCGGMWLARGEIQEAVKAVLERLPDLRLDPAAAPPEMKGAMVRSYRPLNVLFEPQPPLRAS